MAHSDPNTPPTAQSIPLEDADLAELGEIDERWLSEIGRAHV